MSCAKEIFLCPIGLPAMLCKLYGSDDGLGVQPTLVTCEKCVCVVQDSLVDTFIDCSATNMCYCKKKLILL
jgi:hypothetical protein